MLVGVCVIMLVCACCCLSECYRRGVAGVCACVCVCVIMLVCVV